MYAIYIYMLTFTINIPQMLAYIPYMDPMGHEISPTGDSEMYASEWCEPGSIDDIRDLRSNDK